MAGGKMGKNGPFLSLTVEDAGRFTCHGIEGKGDGPSASELKDFWGRSIQPTDLTRPLKRDSTPKAIYQILVTGLDGTPMPSYALL
jgi:hypothetical protein